MKILTKYSRNNFAVFKNRFLIIGGGDAGSGISSLLRQKYKIPNDDITIIDQQDNYIYQSG